MDGTADESLGTAYFLDSNLGDVRRSRRLAKLFDTMVRHPGGTLPAKLSEPRDLRAFYRIMNAEEVTHQSIMEGHYAATGKSMQLAVSQGATVLVIHDATELDFSNVEALQEKLGQIGEGTHRGFICHNSLAVRADTQEVLGLTSQILHHRADVPQGETDKQCRERKNRESRLWVHGAEMTGRFQPSGLIVDVSDSLSDTFEYMHFEISNKRHFLLRSREDRKLHEPQDGHKYLYEAVRSWRARDGYEVEIAATNQRKARKANVKIAYDTVVIAPPRSRSGDYPATPLAMWAVRVWEPKPRKGDEPLEWILLTNVKIQNVKDAIRRVEWYEARFIIEDYHKGMKTGCGIETMLFDTVERLKPAIGVISALATNLLRMRSAARQPDADVRPATEVVDAIYVRVMSQHYGKRLGKAPTVKQFYMCVARLGGHQNRKTDGFPGWITLWRGWMRLESMVTGYRLAEKKARKCG